MQKRLFIKIACKASSINKGLHKETLHSFGSHIIGQTKGASIFAGMLLHQIPVNSAQEKFYLLSFFFS